MNLAVRQVLTRQTFRLCDRIPYKCISKQPNITSTCTVTQFRNYCEDRVETRKLPPLMEFPPVVWPSFINFIKNWMFANFIIRPYFDSEFSLQEFIEASKHAVQVVSDGLQKSDFKSLEGLVDKDAIASLKTAISNMSVSQRQLLGIKKEDIFYAFPYQVGVMFDDSDKRWVEITMCYHVLKGLKQMQDSGDLPPITLGNGKPQQLSVHYCNDKIVMTKSATFLGVVIDSELTWHNHVDMVCQKINSAQPEFQDKIFILNYRFIREFTKGVEDSWWVNIVNHFQPQSFRK